MESLSWVSDRFEVVRKLGEGGLGVVYEAVDRQRGGRVALKTFKRQTPDDLFRLKREFRALAHLQHPNLCSLFDLVVEDDRACFSMELIDGCSFFDYIGFMGSLPTVRAGDPLSALPCKEDRLRAALPQIAVAVHALHEAGKLHRDIKPTNILVSHDGTLKLLDFGLAIDLSEGGRESLTGRVVGTWAYMAPEQIAGEKQLTPAADWYAVGVILYQALTGVLPFSGTPLEILRDKNTRPVTPPRQLVPELPKDLGELCCRLLETDPNDRESGTGVLSRLGVATAKSRPQTSMGDGPTADAPFMGRQRELAAILDDWKRVRDSRESRVHLVEGASGMGKTTLIKQAVARIFDSSPRATFFSGKCYEREDVPYKGMDGLIDSLVRYWRKLRSSDAGALVPVHAGLLPVLFPAFRRVPAVARESGRRQADGPQGQRTRAYGALREVFQRLAAEAPVVLFLDDMQWVDADSVHLLRELLRPPDPPPLLLLLASRDLTTDRRRSFAGLLDGSLFASTTTHLRPLDRETAEGLTRAWLPDATEKQCEHLVAEAGGNPYFLAELAWDVQHGLVRHAPTLDETLVRRAHELGRSAHQIARILALSGEPLSVDDLVVVVDRDRGEVLRDLRVLRAHNLARVESAGGEERYRSYHDRVREALANDLERRQREALHLALATALESSGNATNEQIARHYRAGGEESRAADLTRLAADEARAALDFDRAAELYRIAWDLSSEGQDGLYSTISSDRTREPRLELRLRLAESLANAGRPHEAAQAYKDTIPLVDEERGLELTHLAAVQLMSADPEEALALLGEVMKRLRIPMAKTRVGVTLRFLWEGLRTRSVSLPPGDRSPPPRRELLRLSVAETVASGFLILDPVRGLPLLGWRAHRGARVGTRDAAIAGYALYNSNLATRGIRGATRRFREELASAVEGPDVDSQARAMVHVARVFEAYFIDSSWKRTLEAAEDSLAAMRAGGRGRTAEGDVVKLYWALALLYGGEIREFRSFVLREIAEAERSGNRFIDVGFRATFPFVHLAADEPEKIGDDVLDGWLPTAPRMTAQHYLHAWSRFDVLLYQGKPRELEQFYLESRRALSRSLLLSLPRIRADVLGCRARMELACLAANVGERGPRIRRLRRILRRLARSNLPPIAGWLLPSLRAGLAHQLGDDDTATVELRRAIRAFDDSSTRLYAAAARLRLGAVVGGERGAELAREGEAYMRDQKIARPELMVATLMPGWNYPGASDGEEADPSGARAAQAK